jgi:uncharacterized protein (DUF433 family)
MFGSYVTVNHEIMGGIPVFTGTRVPIQNLIDCWEEGYSIEEFLDDFPSVKKEQIISVLEEIKEKLPQLATT